MNKIVKSFLVIRPFLLIFFLTGCAAGRYHDRVADGPPPIFGQPASVISSFGWPIQGKIVSSYGATEEGVPLKGIVLEGREGQDVLSAEQGQVVFVDAGMRGYGKTIIVEHLNEYSTVYARNSQILVRAGDHVRKGQVIARIGRDGKGDMPRVYFEVRHYSKSVDPQQVLN